MAPKQTYECYVCKRNNFPGVRVYLDGKTEDGKTIYKNEDMTPHLHKQQQKQLEVHTSNSNSTNDTSFQSALKAKFDMINAKLDRISALLVEAQQQQEQK